MIFQLKHTITIYLLSFDMKLFAFILICLCIIESNGFLHRICGSELNEILRFVCKNGFNTMMTKRNGKLVFKMNKTFSNLWFQLFSIVDNELSYPYAGLMDIFHIEHENLLGKTRRTRMLGIVDECCKKACTFTELSAYCLP